LAISYLDKFGQFSQSLEEHIRTQYQTIFGDA
jgi:hypothetical protein